MYEIPDDFKILLFKKGPAEPLTKEEISVWQECVETEQSKDINVSLDYPIFMAALEIYLHLLADNIAPWEEFERSVLKNNGSSK